MTTDTLERVRSASARLTAVRAEERYAAAQLRNAIRDARAEGHSLAEIGKVLGLSRQRVHALSD